MPERFAAVAELGFFFGGEFGGGFVECGDEEEGVVAKPVLAAGAAQDDAVDFVGDDGEVGLGEGQGHGADEFGVALAVGDGGHRREQLGVVGGIVAGLAGIAGRLDARAIAQGGDTKARIVCQGEPAGVLGVMAGFFGGVADECGAIFDDIGHTGCDVFQGQQFQLVSQTGGRELVANFDEFAAIAGGDQEFHARPLGELVLQDTGRGL